MEMDTSRIFKTVFFNIRLLDTNNMHLTQTLITQSSNSSDPNSSGFLHASTLLFTLGECLIALTAIFGNSIVLFVIFENKILQTFTNYFLASLALADLLVGSIGIPCSIVAFLGLPHGFWGCLFMNTSIIILTQISIFGLLVISLERFTAIQHPFFYKKHSSGINAFIIISCTWTLAILVGFVPIFGWNNQSTYIHGNCKFSEVVNMDYMVFFNFFGFVLIPLLVMFIVYGYIFHIVRKQLRAISSIEIRSVLVKGKKSSCVNKSNESSSENTCTDHVNGSVSPYSDHKTVKHASNKRRKSFVKELRAAKWFAFVILLFACCWCPMHIMNAVTTLSQPVSAPLVLFAILLSHMNSSINPILYAYSNKKFKETLKKLLQCGLSKQTLQESRSAHKQTRSSKAVY